MYNSGIKSDGKKPPRLMPVVILRIERLILGDTCGILNRKANSI